MDVFWNFLVSVLSGLVANLLFSLLKGLASRPKRTRKGK